MLSNFSIGRAVFYALLAASLLIPAGRSRLYGQGATATILGTVTDMSGAAIAGATVEVKNTGTGVAQNAVTDSGGRFRAADLLVGNYDVQASQTGFSTVVHRGITLTVGAQSVVDFSLPVGQQQQTVTVEGQVSQVETTNSTIASLVDQTQMRELPLNGRNFEQLIQLAPGVQNYYAGSAAVGTGTGANMREGRDPAISVAGSRPEGQLFLMDDQNLETFYNRGLDSITGSSLGVDAIGEFQMLTNTYSAQFGGNGAVMNAVSKSGTNDFHGSAFWFLRNSDLDARNFTDPATTPAFRRNQYGGTFGGPVKKDKVFFFANYEGLRFLQGVSEVATVPYGVSSTSTNPATAAAVNAALALYPTPTFALNPASHTGKATVVKDNVARENYVLGRTDWSISNKDSFFARYFTDMQHATYPFSGGNTGLEPELDLGDNQFATAEEKHIFSPTMINTARVSFSRTKVTASEVDSYPALQFFPGQPRTADGTITISGLTGLGLGLAAPMPELQLQNRYSEGDDLAWIKGSHTMGFGVSIDRVQSTTFWPANSGSSWVFTSLSSFLAGSALNVSGVLDNGTNYPYRDFREIDFAFYAHDDWKVSPKLTVNYGLRYDPTTNPVEAHNLLYAITNFATATGFTNVPHAFKSNPSMTNFDPRVGFAYDLFADHKTSIRGGFGIFHDVIYAGQYAISYINSPPWSQIEQTPATFPFPFAGNVVPNATIGNGWDWAADKTPYLIEYNLNIQRELASGMVLSVGYVGSHGVNLFTEQEQNPVPARLVNGTYVFSPTCGATNTLGGPAACGSNSGRTNPAIGSFTVGENGSTSRYDSLQASLNRRLSHNLQAQASYTYSLCISDGDAVLASLSGNTPTLYENPYDREYDKARCAFNATQTFRLNALYDLPFHGNRLVTGWQISGIFSASSGLPFNVTDGVDQSNQINATSTVRPNYAPNNPAVTVNGVSYPACNNNPIVGTANLWFNPNCFSQEAFGTLGNEGRNGLIGPGLADLDMALLKTTRLKENVTLQFRAEFFNVLNHTNLSIPVASVFTGSASPTATLTYNTATAGQILTPAVPSREIQFGLKLIF